MRLILTIFIIFFYLIGCSNKENEKLIIIEKDSIKIEDSNLINEKKQYINDTTLAQIDVKIDTLNKKIKNEDTLLIEKKRVTEFKKNIFAKTIDLNFDRKGDLALIYIIATEKDTITYLSIYLNKKNEMQNTFDIRFDEKIDKILSISTYTDSTIVINALDKNSKKAIHKKFKFIHDHYYQLLN